MATNGSPSKWCRRNWASCSSTTRSPNSTTPSRRNAWPIASPGSTGRRSSTVGPSRSIRCWANGSPATPCIGSSIKPFATDLLFKSRAALAGLYRTLLDYAVRTFTPKDILGFLGRKWDRRFDGEVHTHCEDERWCGTRIKHRMKSNWLKMYDKFGLILRVETVINSPKEFWVYRT